MSLILPPDVERERAINQEMHRQLQTVKEFNRELALIDPRLELVWLGEKTPHWPGIVPGRWHVMRRNESGPASFKAIVGPDDEYMEPHSGVFDQLREMDLWSADGLRRKREQKAREAADRERRAEALRAEAREEFALRLKAVTNPGIRFGGKGWTASKGDL